MSLKKIADELASAAPGSQAQRETLRKLMDQLHEFQRNVPRSDPIPDFTVTEVTDERSVALKRPLEGMDTVIVTDPILQAYREQNPGSEVEMTVGKDEQGNAVIHLTARTKRQMTATERTSEWFKTAPLGAIMDSTGRTTTVTMKTRK